jgi:hypothetical protein
MDNRTLAKQGFVKCERTAIEPTIPCHNQTLSIIESKNFTLRAKPLTAPPVQERDAMPAEGSGVAGSKSGTLVGGMWFFLVLYCR